MPNHIKSKEEAFEKWWESMNTSYRRKQDGEYEKTITEIGWHHGYDAGYSAASLEWRKWPEEKPEAGQLAIGLFQNIEGRKWVVPIYIDGHIDDSYLTYWAYVEIPPLPTERKAGT
jgi:hypothetical protein